MAPSSYFPSLTVDGRSLSLVHLEPFVLRMNTQTRPGGVNIDVRFSNHCFSETFDAARHGSNAVDVMDGRRRRVFSPLRYELSRTLPLIVQGLPFAHVYQTPEANFLRISNRADGGEGDYRMFFRVKRGMDRGAELRLFVESAYSPHPGVGLATAYMSKVRFVVLVDKVLRGETPRFHRKR